jgi:hypothetical protein
MTNGERSMPIRNLLILAFTAALLPASASRLQPRTAPVLPPPATLVPDYGNLPLSFERNEGQSDPRVPYLARGGGYTLFLTPSEAVLSLRGGEPDQEKSPAKEPGARRAVRNTVVRLKLVGANPAPNVWASDEMAGKSHYFVGHDPGRWRRDVAHYGRVRFGEVYPGVDLVYHGRQGRLEYDFVVSPGADPRSIRVRLEGAEATKLDGDGNLVLETRAGRLVQQAPVVYQEIDGERRQVTGRYVLNGGNEVGFEVGPHDIARPLVIDPVLAYSTYLGGSSGDAGKAIAIDDFGSAYVTGYTTSANFPAQGSYQTDQAGTDVFVTKLSPPGSSIVYSTYLGGSGEDFGTGIAVDAAGTAWVTGRTSSADFPTVHPFQTQRGGLDAFVTKLAPSGSSLVYSTYLGGRLDDAAAAIAVDAVGSAYVTGYTCSDDFPTVNPFETAQGGCEDAFVTKVAPSGTSLVYSTYLGGTSSDLGKGIAVDAVGSAVVTGDTCSPDFPLANPLQTSLQVTDAFVTRLTPSGSTLVYSTLLGGAGVDVGEDVALDGSGNAYVTGYTDSTDFPTLHAYQLDQGARDAFLTKVTPTGSALVYSTYLGGGADDIGFGIAVDVTGSAYVAGATKSADFPTKLPLQAYKGNWDAFVTKFAPSGASLVYSTYLGGNDADRAFGIVVDGSGSAYIVGDTNSANFPLLHPVQLNQPGTDAFVAKLSAVTKLGYFTVRPCRLVDTRDPLPEGRGQPPLNCSPIPVPRTFDLSGICSIPDDVLSIAVNVTVTESTGPGELRFFPAGTHPPITSTITYTSARQYRSNNGIPLLGTGHLAVTCHQPSGTAHVVIDVTGYFADVTTP